jgi:uncharacterized membrane protein SirB2
MNSLTLLNIALVFHLVGLVSIAGATLLDLITTGQFWKKYSINKHDALAMRELSRVFPIVARAGGALLVLSGIAMMTVMHGAYGSQTWMRIKIGLVVLIIVNMTVFGRRNATRLSGLLDDERNGTDRTTELEKVRSSTRMFHLSQVLFLLTIFTLSVFKFN